MLKFQFSLKTRDGQKVECVLIQGKDLADAERKLLQMYRNCEVTRCETINSDKAVGPSADIEEVLSLITRQS